MDNRVAKDCAGAESTPSHSFQEEEAAAGIQFSPPLYLQRYMLAVEYLTKHSIQTVVDFGCSECGFFRLLPTVASLQDISLVDIDLDLLKTRTRAISPELKDYVNRRSNPLVVSMYAGSAGDFDARMKDYEAVTLIEVIEHLYPDVLEAVTLNVFGNIHPSHVIVTTPNAEFNVLFGNEDPTAFRHWDHKFEWTREEFHEWCQNVCRSYGYEVEYAGVGFQPSIQKSSELGPCSQAAFFKRISAGEAEGTETNCLPDLDGKEVYELIAKSEFPYDDIKMSREERLDLEIMYALRKIAFLRMEVNCDNSDDDDDSFCIEVRHLANRSHIKRLAGLQDIRDHLRSKSFEISEDGERVTVNTAQFIDPSSDEDDDFDDNRDYSGGQNVDNGTCDWGGQTFHDGDSPTTQRACTWLTSDEECWDTETTAIT